MAEKSSRQSGGGSKHHSVFPLWAILLIVIGIVFLLNNFGFLPWGVWDTLWRFWPIAIILIGVNIIWGRSHPWLISALTLLVVVVVLGIGIGVAAVQGGAIETNSRVSEPLGDLAKAEVEVDFGAGTLYLDSLAPGNTNLVEADGVHKGWGRDGGIVSEIDRRSGVGILKLSQKQATWFFSGGDRNDVWHVHLTPNIPMELTIRTGASDSRIDLSGLRISKLNLETGASSLSLILPVRPQGTVIASVKGGAATIEIAVPQDVAARFSAQTGLSSVNIDQQRFPKVGSYYQTQNYDAAVNKIDLQLQSGVSTVKIR